MEVPEDHKVNEKIGVLVLQDRDQLQNKEPTFIIPNDISRVFGIELSPTKDGNLMLRKVGHWCSTALKLVQNSTCFMPQNTFFFVFIMITDGLGAPCHPE